MPELNEIQADYFAQAKVDPDAVLLMRVGDWYEAFGLSARTLNTETGHALQASESTVNCGIAAWSLSRTVQALQSAGYRVIVSERPGIGQPYAPRSILHVA